MARRRTPLRRAVAAAVGVGMLVSTVGCAVSSSGGSVGHRVGAAGTSPLHGVVVRPATQVPRSSLAATSGHRVDLAAPGRHRVRLVYFGYTHCPDVCPTVLADIAQALRGSAPAVRAAVQVDFVTVDPRRDTLPVVRRWLRAFGPQVVGLRTSVPRVISLQRRLGIPASHALRHRPRSHHRKGYVVEHTAEVLAVTPDGRSHVMYLDGPSTSSDLRHDLPLLLTAPAYA